MSSSDVMNALEDGMDDGVVVEPSLAQLDKLDAMVEDLFPKIEANKA